MDRFRRGAAAQFSGLLGKKQPSAPTGKVEGAAVTGFLCCPIVLGRLRRMGFSEARICEARSLLGRGSASFEDVMEELLVRDSSIFWDTDAFSSVPTLGASREFGPPSDGDADVTVGKPYVLTSAPTEVAAQRPLARIHDVYTLEDEELGEGGFGTVHRIFWKGPAGRAPRAVKMVARDSISEDPESLAREAETMRAVDHPNIIRLVGEFEESVQDVDLVYLVVELCTGGDLLDRVVDTGCFSEAQAASVMRQVFRAVCHMHKLQICHRDLKCENCLFQTEGPVEDALLKVIDFGLATHIDPGNSLEAKAGSLYYAAPEVYIGKYDHTVDLWSCGCVLYVMLCGYAPFFGGDDDEVLARTRQGILVFKDEDWSTVSADSQGLVQLLLDMDPQSRIAAKAALKHKWIIGKESTQNDTQASVLRTLLGNCSHSKLKRIALHIIAEQLEENAADEAISDMRGMFMSLDSDGDGFLGRDDLCQVMPLADVENLLSAFCPARGGEISYSEFLAASLDRSLYEREAACWWAFQKLDLEEDGVLTQEEVLLSGDSAALPEEFGKLTAGIGQMSFRDFVSMMRDERPALE